MAEISEEKKKKLRKAHERKMTVREAAEDAEVSQWTVKKYWKKDELKSHYMNKGADIPADILIEEVFRDYSEELSFQEIKERIEENIGYTPLDKVIESSIDSMVEQGFYERFSTCKDERYKLAFLV